jgi:hypothetical protein
MMLPAAAKPVYKLLGAAEQLVVQYPAGEHGFPADVREKAYQWPDRVFK